MEKETKNLSIEQAFLAATTLEKSQNTRELAGENPPMPERPVKEGTRILPLPEPELLSDVQGSFLELMELRTTVRQYSEKPLTLKELSYLLWCTQGVKEALPNARSMRTVPGAGGRHAFETYLYIQKVEGLAPGLYRFLAFEHALLPVAGKDEIENALLAGFKSANMVRQSAVTFIWTAAMERMLYKFGSRGYRYIFLDAGHVCQNLYLAAYTIQAGVCAVGAFYDDKLNAALSLDGVNDFAVYAATAGKIGRN